MRTGDLERMNTTAMKRRKPEDLPQSNGLPAVLLTDLDARTDPVAMFNLAPGAATVIRNLGGRVTPEVITQLGALAGLAATMIGPDVHLDVAVIQNTTSGALMLADDGIRARVAEAGRIADADLADLGVGDPTATVAADVGRLLSSGLPAGITVSGYVYDTASGAIHQVVDDRTIGN